MQGRREGAKFQGEAPHGSFFACVRCCVFEPSKCFTIVLELLCAEHE